MSARIEAGLRVSLRDGVCLSTDVYRPRGAGRVPAVLLRTPYGKQRHVEEGLGWVAHGFGFAAQDVRGRWESEGRFDPYAHEADDGPQAVEWLAAQPWCDGQVVTSGGSYAAQTALAAAVHPAVRAVIASVPALGRRATVYADDGIARLESHAWWWTTYAECRTERPDLFRGLLTCAPDLLRRLPLRELPAHLGAPLGDWLRPLEQPQLHDGEPDLPGLGAALMSVGGFHDAFVEGSLRVFDEGGAARDPRPARALVLGPWGHELRTRETRLDERVFGPQARLSLGALQVEWLRGLLGRAEPAPDVDVHVYVDGQDRWLGRAAWDDGGAARWRARGDWPEARGVRLFPAPGGALLEAPPAESSAAYESDPRDPFPSQVLPRDVSATAGRRDAARFESAPLERPLAFAGAPRFEAWAESDAPACDFVARLCEVHADGRSVHLTWGAASVCSATGAWEGRVALALRPLCLVVPRGHRLRLEITSSFFPALARHPQTLESRLECTRLAPARQRLRLGGARPAVLVLPELGA